LESQDDGLFLGGGANFTRYGFKKNPYGVKHHFFFKFSTQTSAVQFNYSSDFTKAIGKLSFSPGIFFDRPLVFNYYGRGNNTSISKDDANFHRVRLRRLKVETLLRNISKNKLHTTQFGPFFQNVDVRIQEDRISNEPQFFNSNDMNSIPWITITFLPKVGNIMLGLLTSTISRMNKTMHKSKVVLLIFLKSPNHLKLF